jgi:hypothetical protein
MTSDGTRQLQDPRRALIEPPTHPIPPESSNRHPLLDTLDAVA